MSTLGNKTTGGFSTISKQSLTGDGGTSYTLQQSVNNENELEVYVNNTRQEPTTAYTAQGTTLTMTGAVNASDSFYVIFQGKAVVSQEGIFGNSSTRFTSDNVTIGGTLGVTGATTLSNTLAVAGDVSVDTNTLHVDASNNRVGVGTTTPLKALHVQGSSEADIFLRREDLTNKSWLLNVQSSTGDLNVKSRNDDGTAIATSFIAHQSGYLTKPNLPSFLTYGSPTMTDTSGNHGYFHSFGNSGQSFDNGSNYNNTTGRFTCPVAGKYMFGLSISRNQSYSGANQLIYIGKNGDVSGAAYVGSNASASQQYDQIQCHFIYNMAVNDFAVPLYYNASGTFTTLGSTPRNYFYGFLIG